MHSIKRRYSVCFVAMTCLLLAAQSTKAEEWPRIIEGLKRGGSSAQQRQQLSVAYNNYAIELSNQGNWAQAETELQRAELQLFNFQKESILAREDMITAARRPKVGAFLQAGFGAPNPLNFFDESLSPFAMAGVKFSWKIFDWDQSSRDRQLLALKSQMVNQQRDAFEASIERMDGKYQEDIATLEKLMQRDEEIARLQERILGQVSSKLEQGVATSTDYITQANALAQARLNRQLHELQQQQLKVDYLTLKGQL